MGKAPTIPLPDWAFPTFWKYVLDDSRCAKEPIVIDFPDFVPDEWCEKFGFTEYGLVLPNIKVYFEHCLCRFRNHQSGVNFYNAGGTEPDFHCKGCGENLG